MFYHFIGNILGIYAATTTIKVYKSFLITVFAAIAAATAVGTMHSCILSFFVFDYEMEQYYLLSE